MPQRFWLLLLPFVGLLWVPFYNFRDPLLFGFPFFYWYQLAWILAGAGLVLIVYWIESTHTTEEAQEEAEPSGVPGDIL